jgi:di- and tripeptidase
MSLTFTHSAALESTGVGRSNANSLSYEAPILAHSLKHDKSILALLVSSSYIFAGTEDGEILVCPDSQDISVQDSRPIIDL